MKELKYIIVDYLTPIIFGDAIQHKEVAKGLKVTSAGFCIIRFIEDYANGDRYRVTVHGESESLNLKSDPKDAKKIEQTINYY